MEEQIQDGEKSQGLQFSRVGFQKPLNNTKDYYRSFDDSNGGISQNQTLTQGKRNDSTQKQRRSDSLSRSNQNLKLISDNKIKYISSRKIPLQFQQQVFVKGYPIEKLQYQILLQKLSKSCYSKLKAEIQKASSQRMKILTTSHSTKYLLQFFILTVIIQNFRRLTANQLLKHLPKRIIFKKIMKNQYTKLKKKVNYGYNCPNLKLLLQSDEINDQMLNQSTLIEIILDTKNSPQLKMYYICFVPKLKQIRNMDKNVPYKQVWKKNDQRSIQFAKKKIYSFCNKQQKINSSAVQIQSLINFSDLSDEQRKSQSQ